MQMFMIQKGLTLVLLTQWMTVKCQHSRWRTELMMNLVDVFIKKLRMQQPMDIIEGKVVNYIIDNQFVDQNGEGWNFFCAIGNIVGGEAIDEMKNSPKEDPY